MKRPFICCVASFFIFLCGELFADILILKDGRVFDGVDLESSEGGYLVHFEHGDVFVPSRLIESAVVEGGESPLYEANDEFEHKKIRQWVVAFSWKVDVSKKERERNSIICPRAARGN